MGINKDQVKGRANIVSGKVTAAVGKAVGNEKMEGQGNTRETLGKAQAHFGDIKADVKDALKDRT